MPQHRRRPQGRPHPRPALVMATGPATPTGGPPVPAPGTPAPQDPATPRTATCQDSAPQACLPL
ncbi:hypothetical protein [Streptomyces sp. NPDC007991]|uniref:hypothetical protein n=1 Tax=Streptomyces sp. NPDC007991 TaxID=3364803 RepID=UPI0036ECB916